MILRHLFLAFLLIGLFGCADYRPLYGQNGSGHSVAVDLAGVAVEEQGTRVGQIVRNDLLSGLGNNQSARYSLRLSPVEKIIPVSSFSTNLPSRYRYNLVVEYSLINLGSGKTVTSGRSFSNVSYDNISQPVSDMAAMNNAMERAAHEVSQDLRQRIAATLFNSK
jgi:LPS-assembly lipoprotein